MTHRDLFLNKKVMFKVSSQKERIALANIFGISSGPGKYSSDYPYIGVDFAGDGPDVRYQICGYSGPLDRFCFESIIDFFTCDPEFILGKEVELKSGCKGKIVKVYRDTVKYGNNEFAKAELEEMISLLK